MSANVCALCGAARSAGAVLLCDACAASVAAGQDHTRPCACEHCERCDRADAARDHTYDGTRDRVYVLDLPEVVEATARLQREMTERLAREREELHASVNELAAQQQRLMAMIGAQTAEKVRLLTDLADTRAALRAHLRCDECEELATRLHAATASFCCDAHAVGEGWSDTTHAAAVRAAMEGGR